MSSAVAGAAVPSPAVTPAVSGGIVLLLGTGVVVSVTVGVAGGVVSSRTRGVGAVVDHVAQDSVAVVGRQLGEEGVRITTPFSSIHDGRIHGIV